ncbi:MAG: hypothetical protein V4436_01540 [Patescibacteria group bacterium]
MPFGATIALAVSLALGGAPSQANSMPTTTLAGFSQSQTVEQYVREYFADEPIMAEIASCESQFRQFGKDGKIIKNPTSSAVGLFQIMSSIHSTFADDKLGLDIYSLQGNAAYARYLFDRQGTTPWDSSKPCWGKSKAYKELVVANAKTELALK